MMRQFFAPRIPDIPSQVNLGWEGTESECQDIEPEQQAVAEAQAINDKQALDEYSMWRVSVDRGSVQ